MVMGVKLCPQCGGTYEAAQRFCPLDGAALRGQAADGSLVGEVIAERYHVVRRLGEGGMGEVYLAEHVRMGRPSAVKVMRPDSADDPDAVSRFNREAANASRVSHRNVAAIYDFGETAEGLIYLAMEYVEGEPLRTLLDRVGALPPARAVAIAAQVADALEAAHALGIVHRDLKPDNVMVGRDRDGSDLIKVVDFGIAKASGAEGQQVTRTGLIVGTPEYMSPEQLAGDPSDGRSDVYALGLICYAMLTGLHPFPSETVQDTLVLRLTTPPLRLAQLRPDVSWPEAAQRVLDGALARRPADRCASAPLLARELAAAFGLAVPDARPGVGAIAAAAEAPTQVLAAGGLSAVPAGTRAGSGAILPPTRVAGGSAEHHASRRRARPAVMGAVAALAATIGLAAWQFRAPRPTDTATHAPAAVGLEAESTPQPAGAGTALATRDERAPSSAPAARADSARAAAPSAPVPLARPSRPEPAGTAVERYVDSARLATPVLAARRALAAAERVVEDAGLDRDAVVLALRQVLDARRLVAPASDEALALTVAHAMLRELADTTQRELACAELETAARDPRLDRAVPPLLRETVAPILQRSCGA
ncbi:MAG TPA: protein kinase, partial [Gemmatimonadaceae bacterium]